MQKIIATIIAAQFKYYDDNPDNCYGLQFKAQWGNNEVQLFTGNGFEILQAMKKQRARSDKDLIGCSVLLMIRDGIAEFDTFY